MIKMSLGEEVFLLLFSYVQSIGVLNIVITLVQPWKYFLSSIRSDVWYVFPYHLISPSRGIVGPLDGDKFIKKRYKLTGTVPKLLLMSSVHR